MDRFSKNTQMSKLMKIRPVPCADGKTNGTKFIVAFCNFAYAPKRHKLVQRDIRFNELYNLIGDGGVGGL